MNGFPPDPPDGMIFEIEPGIYYQYDKKSLSWIRLAGYQTSINQATSFTDGLMSKEDYQKLKGLLIPPPFTSLTSTGCGFTFEAGTFGFRSSADDVMIDYEVKLRDEVSGIDRYEVFHIHENTYGLDFRVNQERLVEELTTRGHLTYKKRIGEQGKQGKRGNVGKDKLNTGPVGKIGNPGKNTPWPGVLSLDTTPSPTDFTQGIVDIFTEEISPSENYLVMVKGNIVNSSYCPRFVKPSKIDSPWIVVIDDRPDSITKYRSCESVDSCGLECSGLRTTLIPYCTSKLYYMDITDILANIKSRFEIMLTTLKAEKEKVVTGWLNNMIAFFSEQKLALCCAINNVNSAVENQRVREYIEAQRIQAAQAEMQLVIGDRDNAEKISLNGGFCQFPPKGNSGDPPPLTDLDPVIGDISPAFAIVDIDAQQNYNEITAITVPLSPGKYRASLSICCVELVCIRTVYHDWPKPGGTFHQEAYKGYTGRFMVSYLAQPKNGPPKWTSKSNQGDAMTLEVKKPCNGLDPSDPSYDDEEKRKECARNEFLGTGPTFEHVGTDIKLWFSSEKMSNCHHARQSVNKADFDPRILDTGYGWLQVVIREATTYLTPLVNCSTVPPLPTDIAGVSNPDDPDVFNCDMSAECVNWYETGWRTGACCGVHLSAGGMDWIVVKRSIADDIICGGGESLNTPCIKGALEFGFHPSVAYPTSNGLEFLGKPTSSQRLFRDINLETEIMSKIRSGTVYSIKGDPVHNFEAILFPYDIIGTGTG